LEHPPAHKVKDRMSDGLQYVPCALDDGGANKLPSTTSRLTYSLPPAGFPGSPTSSSHIPTHVHSTSIPAPPPHTPRGRKGKPEQASAQSILVIGNTGSGKTTFINLAADANLQVGPQNRGEPCTKEIQTAQYRVGGELQAVLYDVPDLEEPESIDAGLEAYIVPDVETAQFLWTAVICVVDISRNRDALFRNRNYLILEKLKQRHTLQRLVFLVTMWPEDRVGREEARLEEYKRELFRKYTQNTHVIFSETGEQAKYVVSSLLQYSRTPEPPRGTGEIPPSLQVSCHNPPRGTRTREGFDSNLPPPGSPPPSGEAGSCCDCLRWCIIC